MNLSFPFLKTVRGKQITFALVLVFLGSLTIDQVSKRHAHKTLMKWEDPSNLSQFGSYHYHIGSIGRAIPEEGEVPFFMQLEFEYQRNRGAAFSMLDSLDDRIRVPFFYIVTILSVIFIGSYLRTLPLNFHLTRFGLVMIMSGAIGNFIDRLIQGYVIDFVSASWNLFGWKHNFAVFNVADIAINIGLIAFVLEMLLRRKPVYADFSAPELKKA